MAGPSYDRISLLPDCILEFILVLLPLCELVRTSILSKRWVSLWTQVPKLVFDKSFFQSIKNDKSRIMPIIREILLRRRQPLLEFTFSLSGVSSFDLDLPMHYQNSYGDEYFELDGELYNLLSLDELRFLKCLGLESCLCTFPHGFRGFAMLTNLNFYNVDIDGGQLSDLVSSCPLLDTLTLDSLTLCFYLDLFAPNLKVFYCEGCFLAPLCFKFTPLLEKITVSFDHSLYDGDEDLDVPEDMVVPYEVISAVKYLMLNGSFLKYMNRGNENKVSRCQSALNHLTVIELADVFFQDIEVAQNVLWLIRRSPNLEMIRVTACTSVYFEPVVGVCQTRHLSDVALNKLRYVYMEKITGKQSELFLIELLLAKSAMLEMMEIRLHIRLTEEENLRTFEKIRRFQRASSRVTVTCYKYKI